MAIPSDPAATSASAASRSTPSPAAASKGKEREKRSSGSDARQLASSYYSSGADDWEEASQDGDGEAVEGEGSSKEKWRQMFDRSFNESRASSLGHASTATKASKPPVIDPEPQKHHDDSDAKAGLDGRARRRPHPANWRMSGMLAKSSSNTTLGRDATELIHGYLNFTARRGDAVRTFALPPSSIDGLSYDTLARILDLDRRIEDSSWAEKGKRKGKSRIKPASSSGGTGASSSYTSFFTGGRNREQPVIYIEHLVDPTAPGDRRTSRPYTKWSKLAPWPQDSLQGFLIADFFRRQVGRDQWVNLVVKEKGQGPPTDDEGFGPSGLSRIGKGLSRLSWGLGSLFNGLDSPLRSPGSPGAAAGEQTVKRQQYLQLKDNLFDDAEEGSGDTAASRLRDAPAKTASQPASPTLPRWLRSVWPFRGAAATASSQQRADATGPEDAPAHRAVARPPQASEQDARELDISAITPEAAATAAAKAKATSATRSAAGSTSSASPPQTRPRRRSLLVSDTLRQAYLEGKARLSGTKPTPAAAGTPTDASAPRSRPRPRLRQGLTHLGKALVSPFAIALNLHSPTDPSHSPSQDDDDDSDAFNRRERERLTKRAWLPPPASKPQAGKSLAKFVSFRSLTPSRTSTSSATPATATSPSSSRDAAALPRGARGAVTLPKSPLSPQQQQANRDRPAPGPLLRPSIPAPALQSSPLAPPEHRRLIERTDLSVRNWRPSVALPPPGTAPTVTASSPEQWQALAAQTAQAGPAAGIPALGGGGGGTSGRFSRRRSSKKKKQLHQQQQHLGPSPKQAFPSSSSSLRAVNDKAAPAPAEQEGAARRVPLNSTLEILDVVEALGTDPPNSSRDRDAAPRPTSPSRAESDVVVASWDVNAAVGEIEDEVLSTDDEEEEDAQRSSGGGGAAPREGEKHSILVSPMKGSGGGGEAGRGVRVDTPLVPLLAGKRGANNGGGGLFRKGSTASATSSGSGSGGKLLRKKPSAWKRRFGGGAATRGRRVSAAGGAGGAGDENDAAEAAPPPPPAAWLSSSTSSLPDASGGGGRDKEQQEQDNLRPPSQQHVMRRTASLLAVRNGGGNGTGQHGSLTPPSRSSSLRRRDKELDAEAGAIATSGRRRGSRGAADGGDGKKSDAVPEPPAGGGVGGGAQPVRSAEDATRDYMRRAWGDGDGGSGKGQHVG